MIGLHILKHIYNLSDEMVCEQYVVNPYYQYFCGEEFFQHGVKNGKVINDIGAMIWGSLNIILKK